MQIQEEVMSLLKITIIALIVVCLIVPLGAIPVVLVLCGALSLWVWGSDEVEKLTRRLSEKEAALHKASSVAKEGE